MIELKLTVSGTYGGKKWTGDVLHTAQFGKFLGNWAPAWRFIAHEVLEPFVEMQFQSQGEAGGEKWAELAESTLKERGQTAGEALVLYRSGKLAHSFLEGEPGHVEQIDEKKLSWGSAVPYSLYHQTGFRTRLGSGKENRKSAIDPEASGRKSFVPARPGLVITKEMTNRIMLAMQARLQMIARQLGYGILGGEAASPLEAGMAGLEELGAGF
jgi:phage gpG-like protein